MLELFQDPLRASDKALTSSGPYMMKEEDATVYRRPYLVSGSSGFALNAITRAMGKDLKVALSSITSFFLKTRVTLVFSSIDVHTIYRLDIAVLHLNVLS